MSKDKGREPEAEVTDEVEDDDDGVIVMVDAEGNEVEFGYLGIIEEDEGDYVLLAKIEQLEAEDDGPLDVFIFHYSVDEDENEHFAPVDDDELFERLSRVAEQMLEEDGEE